MKIYRSFEIRALEDSRTIEGQAIVFDSYSRDLGGFIERISPEALTEDALSSFDVIMNYNHNDNQMLARYNKGEGTLSLELREDGLYFKFEAPETSLGNDILYHVRNGNLTECSFAAIITKDHIQRYKENGQYVQVINKIDNLVDCSIVNRAAYAATSVSARDEEEAKKEFDEIKAEVDAKEEEKRLEEEKIAEEKRQKEIIDNLNSLKESFLNEIK